MLHHGKSPPVRAGCVGLAFACAVWLRCLMQLFIIGGPRTGTTLLATALLDCGFAGQGEGHFLAVTKDLLSSISQYYQRNRGCAVEPTTLRAIPEDRFSGDLKAFIAGYISRFHGEKSWMDKSGFSGLQNALLYQEMFTDSRFIHTKRRPIEVMVSRLKKFPDHTFEHHCENLRWGMSLWLERRRQLNNAIEIEQFEIIRNPEQTATTIADFLGLEGPDRLMGWFQQSTPERSSDSYTPMRFDDLPWLNGQKDLFIKTLDGAMREYGYSYNETYYTGV